MSTSTRKASHPLHIGIVSQWYKPENVAIPSDLAEHLLASGHRVTVLTGFPNYPAGAVYPGYRQRWTQRDLVEGVRVMRSPLYASHDSNPLKRALNYLSFAASSSLHAKNLKSCDVIYVYCSPITATAAALVCKLLWKIPVVAHVQDLWPESVTQSGMVGAGRRGSAHRALSAVCDGIYRQCSALVTIAPRMSRMLTDRGLPEKRMTSIYNWSPVSSTRSQDEEAPTPVLPGPRTVVYAGNLGVAQDLTAVADAAQACGADLSLRIRMVGGGVLAAPLKERALTIPQLTVEDPIDVTEMEALYRSCDFSLVTLRDVPLFEGTIPSKFQASLAHGLPVITSIRGDVADVVETYGCGFFADPSIKGSMADALRRASTMSDEELSRMQDGCRRATEELFDKVVCLDKLAGVLVSAATTTN